MEKHLAVIQFEAGAISAEEALQELGEAIRKAFVGGLSTAHLEVAVSQVLGMGAEPTEEDEEGRRAWADSVQTEDR